MWWYVNWKSEIVYNLTGNEARQAEKMIRAQTCSGSIIYSPVCPFPWFLQWQRLA